MMFCLAASQSSGGAELERGQVQAQLLAGEFTELTQLFVALDKAFAEKSVSVWDIERAYDEFRTSDFTIALAVDRWIEAEPGSYPARVAKAVQIAYMGGLMRGRDIGVYQGGPAPEAAFEFELAGVRELNKTGKAGADSPVAFSEAVKSFIAMGKNDAVNDFIQQRWAEGRGSALDYLTFARSLEPWALNIGATWDEALVKLKEYLRIVDEGHGADPEFDWIDGYYDYIAAEVARRRGDFRAAVAGFSQAIAAGEQPHYYFGRGVAYIQLNEGERAMADLNAAIILDPYFGDAYSQIGGWQRRNGRFDLALSAYERAVALDPLNPEYLCGRASVLVLLDRMDEARADVDKALTYGHYSPWVQTWRAFVYRDSDPAIAAEAERLAAEYRAPSAASP